MADGHVAKVDDKPWWARGAWTLDQGALNAEASADEIHVDAAKCGELTSPGSSRGRQGQIEVESRIASNERRSCATCAGLGSRISAGSSPSGVTWSATFSKTQDQRCA